MEASSHEVPPFHVAHKLPRQPDCLPECPAEGHTVVLTAAEGKTPAYYAFGAVRVLHCVAALDSAHTGSLSKEVLRATFACFAHLGQLSIEPDIPAMARLEIEYVLTVGADSLAKLMADLAYTTRLLAPFLETGAAFLYPE